VKEVDRKTRRNRQTPNEKNEWKTDNEGNKYIIKQLRKKREGKKEYKSK
jgi:hypothetical protein